MTEEKLTLRSQISELSVIPSWIEHLALQDAIPVTTQFAMNLCLEEAVSNIIRHGYAGETNRSIVVHYAKLRDGRFVLVVDDEAPPFNPVDAPVAPAALSLDAAKIGGHGIRLLRKFADAVDYESTAQGNRLTMGFFSDAATVPTD